MKWEKWVPERKVTAGGFAAAVAFLIVYVGHLNDYFTASEAVIMGGALTTIVAYLVPNRKDGDT